MQTFKQKISIRLLLKSNSSYNISNASKRIRQKGKFGNNKLFLKLTNIYQAISLCVNPRSWLAKLFPPVKFRSSIFPFEGGAPDCGLCSSAGHTSPKFKWPTKCVQRRRTSHSIPLFNSDN